MVAVGDSAPDFTAPLANGDVAEFTLRDRLDEAPLVFAFFPGAFTSVCTSELERFDERLVEFDDIEASVYGVSVDTPFALNAYRDDLGISFGLISDTNRRIVDAWDLAMDFASMGVEDVAERAVVVVDGDREVRYVWTANDPSIEPPYDDVYEATADLV